jgi:HNH endonuclease
MSKLTQQRLKYLLAYNYDTGIFTWVAKSSKNSGTKIGSEAGSLNEKGYLKVQIDGKSYSLHRLVWLYHFGVFPTLQIDHIDGNRSNNKFTNLRECSQRENLRSQKMYSTNTSGVTGVYLLKNKYNGKLTEYWVAEWYDTPREKESVYFPVAEHGHDKAFDLAVDFRAEKIKELNALGARYGERHGKPIAAAVNAWGAKK